MNSNDITGARLISRANSEEYEENYDRIFRKKVEELTEKVERCIIHDNEKDVEND